MRVEGLKLVPAGAKTADVKSWSEADGKSFGAYLSEALSEVNNLQHKAEQASMNLAAGKVQDVAEVVIAAEKASIALQLTMQVRNKVIDAYQEIMRMQV